MHHSSDSGELRERQRGIASLVLGAHVLSELGGISLLSVLNSAITDDSSVNGARYAVRQLHVDLGHLEVSRVVSVVFLDISL